jgi:hypothetical protein
MALPIDRPDELFSYFFKPTDEIGMMDAESTDDYYLGAGVFVGRPFSSGSPLHLQKDILAVKNPDRDETDRGD